MITQSDLMKIQMETMLDDVAIRQAEQNFTIARAIAQYGLSPSLAMIMDPDGDTDSTIQTLVSQSDTTALRQVEDDLLTNLIFGDDGIGTEASSFRRDIQDPDTRLAVSGLVTGTVMGITFFVAGTVLSRMKTPAAFVASLAVTTAISGIATFFASQKGLAALNHKLNHDRVLGTLEQVKDVEKQIIAIYGLIAKLSALKPPSGVAEERTFKQACSDTVEALRREKVPLGLFGFEQLEYRGATTQNGHVSHYYSAMDDEDRSTYDMVKIESSGWTAKNIPETVKSYSQATSQAEKEFNKHMGTVIHDVELSFWGRRLMNYRTRIVTVALQHIDALQRETTRCFDSLKKIYK